MAIFVVDASVALAWCFEDEASTHAKGIHRAHPVRMKHKTKIVSPGNFPDCKCRDYRPC